MQPRHLPSFYAVASVQQACGRLTEKVLLRCHRVLVFLPTTALTTWYSSRPVGPSRNVTRMHGTIIS